MAKTDPVLVDSNVILDIAYDDPEWRAWSEAAVEQAGEEAILVISPIIYAEVSIGYARIEHVEAVLPANRFRREMLPYEAAFLAGKSFLRYRRQGGLPPAPLRCPALLCVWLPGSTALPPAIGVAAWQFAWATSSTARHVSVCLEDSQGRSEVPQSMKRGGELTLSRPRNCASSYWE